MDKGTTVTIVVAQAPTQVTVPDVTGQSEDAATQQLSGAGFNVSSQTRPVTDPAQDGVVLSQRPGGGARASQGATVTIVVGQATTATTPGGTPGAVAPGTP